MNERVFIVSTPIGNLDDMTIRGLKVLEEADVILCEDTRHSIKLLNHFGIKTRLLSYHKFNERERIDQILSLIDEGKNIALISDAGTPLLSDPGEILVKELINNGIPFSVVPGANALLPSLILSGLDTKSFSFIGFLPKKKSNRERKLKVFKDYTTTLVFYCAPHDLTDTLISIKEVYADRNAAVCKELTKIHEGTSRGSLDSLIERFSDNTPKGEHVIVVEGNSREERTLSSEEIEEQFRKRTEAGERAKDVIKDLARANNLNKRELYSKLMQKN